MASQLAIGFGFAAVLIMLASVLGTVERRERLAYAVGVLLILAGLSFLPGPAGGVVALVGLAIIVASAIPLLREQEAGV